MNVSILSRNFIVCKILSKYYNVQFLHINCGGCYVTTVYLSSCDKNCMAYKASAMYYLTLFTEKKYLLTLFLEQLVGAM